MKKRRSLPFILGTAFSSVAVLLVGIVILFLALNDNSNLEYPTYSYSEYIDRSGDNEFSSDAGAQLYEAESLELSGSVSIEENANASGGYIVDNLYNASSIGLYFYSDSDVYAQFYVSTSYVSPTNRPRISSNLFYLEVNEVIINSDEYVSPSYNEYDFAENYIETIHVRKGYNHINIVSVVNSYTIDYVLLVSSEPKTTSFESIGNCVQSFDSHESRQTYPAFKSREIDGAVFLYDEDTLDYSVYFSNPDDYITFYIESDQSTDTSMSVSAKKGASSTPGVSIMINDEQISSRSFTLMTDSYTEISLGMVTLRKGINTVTITNLGGYFYLDSIILNADVTLSPTLSHQKFEAEDADINGCSVTSTSYGSGQKVVGSNMAGSSVRFSFVLKQDCELHLSLRLSYAGSSPKYLNEILSMTVSGTSYSVPETYVEPTDYTDYHDYYIGKISLAAGEPFIRITSVSGYYNFDYITLFTNEYSETGLFEEAEDMTIDDMDTIYSIRASNDYYVTSSKEYTALSLFFYCEKAVDLKITVALSYTDPAYLEASTAFDLRVNEQTISYDAPMIVQTSALNEFKEIELSTFSFNKGMNVIKIKNNGYDYGIDYVILGS